MLIIRRLLDVILRARRPVIKLKFSDQLKSGDSNGQVNMSIGILPGARRSCSQTFQIAASIDVTFATLVGREGLL